MTDAETEVSKFDAMIAAVDKALTSVKALLLPAADIPAGDGLPSETDLKRQRHAKLVPAQLEWLIKHLEEVRAVANEKVKAEAKAEVAS